MLHGRYIGNCGLKLGIGNNVLQYLQDEGSGSLSHLHAFLAFVYGESLDAKIPTMVAIASLIA